MSQLSNHSYSLIYSSDNTVQMDFPRKIFIDQTPKYLMQLQADSSIFFTRRYTNLWKITDFLLSGRRITRFDFFVFKVNLFVVSQSQISLVILFTVCHAWDNYDFSPKNSVLDQQMISLLIFFFILITCLSGIVLVF